MIYIARFKKAKIYSSFFNDQWFTKIKLLSFLNMIHVCGMKENLSNELANNK